MKKGLFKIFQYLWILTIIAYLAFLLVFNIYKDSQFEYQKSIVPWLITILLGIAAFALYAFFRVEAAKNKHGAKRKVFIHLVLGMALTLIGIPASSKAVELFSADRVKPAVQSVSTQIPTPTSKPKPAAGAATTKVTDSDLIITCTSSHPNCMGQSIKVKQSACPNIYCCGLNGTWSVYANEALCRQTAQGSQNSTSNYPCKITSTGYIYNTKDANECYKFQESEIASNLKNTNCKNENDAILASCLSPCNQKYDEGRSICAWAYTTENATIAWDTTKYGECLDENSDIWGACTKPCYDKAVSEYSICINK